jgi:signal transduction histidine kinase
MSGFPASRLLAFARELQNVSSFSELVESVRAEVMASVGYRHAWLMIAEKNAADELRLIEMAERGAQAWANYPQSKVSGDALLRQVLAGVEPMVIADARHDSRVSREAAARGHCTMVSLPLRTMEGPLGLLMVGTMSGEGVREPTAMELEYLVSLAGQVTVVAAGIRLLELQRQAAREKEELERRVAQVQRLESIGLLAGGVAHDFNNLLTVIMASQGLIEAKVPADVVRDELQAIKDAARRGADLTRQLLAVGRNQPLALAVIEIDALLRELAAMLRRVFPENIAIDFIGHASALSVEGDRSQLDQVFMNLCINARDAMLSGGRLTIETEQVLVNGHYSQTHPWAKSGRYVLVTVTDNGAGMPPEVVDRIFDPFFTTRPERGGTGLGLTVAYGVVRQHGGMLHCYSEPGVGTTFKVYLPLNLRPAAKVGPKLAAAVAGGSERILLAEDDESIRPLGQRILSRAGYVVEVAADGEAACAAVEAAPFDLVVLDMIMPGPGCREVIARMKAARPQLRILLASGYASDHKVAQLVREQCIGFLGKPYDPDGMLNTVRRALDR